MDLVRQRHPSWSDSLIEEIARLEYETAAQQFMEGTVLLVQKLRPKSAWGFYGFPNCYNHKDTVPYNCSKLTVRRNDQLSWMFESSSALFPSIYLHDAWHRNSSLFVKYRLLEAFRRAKQLDGHSIPVYSYVRITYAVSQIYLNEVTKVNKCEPEKFILSSHYNIDTKSSRRALLSCCTEQIISMDRAYFCARWRLLFIFIPRVRFGYQVIKSQLDA